MSLQLSDLSVLAYANNFTLWHYKTPDAAVTTAGYFSSASSMMNVNDLIIASIDTDGTPSTVLYSVTGVSASSVTVTALA